MGMKQEHRGESSGLPEPRKVANPHDKPWYQVDDFLAMGIASCLLLFALLAALASRPADRVALHEKLDQLTQSIRAADGSEEITQSLIAQKTEIEKKLAGNLLKPWIGKPGEWESNPSEALVVKGKSLVPSILFTGGLLLACFAVAATLQKEPTARFAFGFATLFALALASYLLAGQAVIKHYNLEYALWAVLLGLLISNTIGTPSWLRSAARTELFIKTGLVLLGAEVLINKLLALGLPGVLISWVTTPIVLITTYWFGQRILRIPSPSLNMVISADMSVCGVSAAVATAAACRAKKEELSLAIGLSLIFTVVSMVLQPMVVRASGMGPVIGGAWIGGTIDSTGAVAAASELVGGAAKDVAATIKMIQNILIGVISFAVAVYWTWKMEPRNDGVKPSGSEIWRRFPKFVLGFLAVSLLMSWLQTQGTSGKAMVSSVVDGATKSIREWCFCLGFVSIGLESNFREYRQMLAAGKPVVLYVCGQTLNLILSFLMAWLVFTQWFPEVAKSLGGP
jgi:uncharacterized integral membrane protein (TIGR00698 family)